jgi:hypothetical protein
MVTLAGVLVLVVFVAVQPDLFRVAARMLRSSDRVMWFLNTTGDETLARVLNRNIRNSLTAAIVGLGVVNVAAIAVWAIRDRRLPGGFDRSVAWAWALPILLFCFVLVVAKPGYVLPFVPLAAIVIGAFYARCSPRVAAALIATQAVVNVVHFLWLTPFSTAMTGGEIPYRDKPIWQRLASDLQPLTFPTRFTIAESDRHVQNLLRHVEATCPSHRPIILADLAPVDWRRVMFYLPQATAIHSTASGVDFVGHESDFASVPPEGRAIAAECPIIWLSPDEGPGGVPRPRAATATAIPHLGWTTAAGTLRVTQTSITQGTP